IKNGLWRRSMMPIGIGERGANASLKIRAVAGETKLIIDDLSPRRIGLKQACGEKEWGEEPFHANDSTQESIKQLPSF
ncbi:hypothetical protein N9090_00390, partial [bacterium]|nr:hypothetical protein [bacterium]